MTLTKGLVASLALLIGGLAMAYEEPAYAVVKKRNDYEVRHYPPYVVAEVDASGSLSSSGSAAFRILANYIFGDNVGSEKMAMAAPVETRMQKSGTTMAMTAPVITRELESIPDAYRYAFIMERKYTLDTVPKPTDDRISLRETAPRTVAVRRYSGLWSDESYKRNRAQLLEDLQRDGVTSTGEPYLARYNGPLTPWFLRRNEIIVEIDEATL